MAEILLPTQTSDTERMPLQESHLLFTRQLDAFELIIPEVQQNREQLVKAGEEIIEQFELQPELFNDVGRSLVFTAIAERWATNEQQSGKATKAAREEEQEFLCDTVALLANKYSPKLTDVEKQIKDESEPISESTKGNVYDKYTDKESSSLVTEAVKNGDLLGKVKERLGITESNEDPYEIRVLSIGISSQTYGLDSPSPNYDLPYGHPDLVSAQNTVDDVRLWKKGLEERATKFENELGKDSLFAPAWVTEIDGKRLLCISSGLAEKLLDKSVVGNTPWYTDDDLARDFAMFEHEYTHTQGGIMLDRGITFGINLEELRAEHFSGNMQGYQDIKGFFTHYNVITGYHPAKTFETMTKGGDIADIYGLIANQVGLNRMLEVIMASPNNYIEAQSNIYIRKAYEYIGGFDGVLNRLLEDQIAVGNKEQIDERIDMYVNKKAKAFNGPSLDGLGLWDYNRKFGLNVVTDLVNKRAEELGVKQPNPTDA